jgi:amino acid adenylation domain-containing protein
MKVLLTMNLPWFPAVGGANKCNRALAEGLAARGHEVEAVVPALAVPSRWPLAEVRTELERRGIAVESHDGVDTFVSGGVEVHAVTDPARLRAELVDRLRAFAPDRVLVSSEDPSQNLLDAALKTVEAPVIYLSHTPAFLPFGPQAFYPSERRARLLGQAAGIVAVSRFLADYVRRWGGLEAEVFPFPIYGAGPFPDFGREADRTDPTDPTDRSDDLSDRFVTMINPCAVKGISIFLALARSLPEVRFAAVPTWGTTPADREALQALPNVALLDSVDDPDRIYERTRVLLMPSLWQEAFGVTAVEAMLRGIPVLASDVGGLPEAKLGTDFVLPVRPIERFTDRQDANEVTEPVVPEQDIGPWRDALVRLLADPDLYARQSAAARGAAQRFVAGLGIEPFEVLMTKAGDPFSRPSQPRALPWAKEARAFSPSAPLGPTGRDSLAQGNALGGKDGDDLSGLTPEQRALLMLRLRKKAAAKEEPQVPAIPRRPANLAELPLSFAQQRLWFLDQWEPGNPVYNIPAAVLLRGPLDVPAFAATLREIVRRHEALRTSFPEQDGKPVQVIAETAGLDLPVVDLGALPAERRDGEVRRLALEEAVRPFDLARGPLLRVALVRAADQEHVALVSMHHIASDGWSVGVLLGEVAAIYEAYRERRPHRLPELLIQYADLAVWQRGWLQGEELERQAGWWRERLAGMPGVLELPADRRRTAARSFRGGRRPFRLDREVWADLKALSQRQGATPFMTALAAFLALIRRLTGQTDLAVGTPIANRNRAETEGLIGFFVNTLVLRGDVSGEIGLRELIARVREVTLGAYAHQDLPFEEVVKAAAAERDLSHNPLFQVFFALHNTPAAPPALRGLELSFLDVHSGTAKFDFDLMGIEDDGTLAGAVEYNADLFDAPTIDRTLSHWQVLLRAALAAPDRAIPELPLLDEAARHQLTAEWNDTGVDFPRETCLHELIAERAAAQPEAPAVLSDEGDLTYAELRARALTLASRLRGLGVGPGDRVGISVGPGPERVIGLLSIAEAGGAYVPLDPAYPAARLELMLADARATVVIREPLTPDPSPIPSLPPGEGRPLPPEKKSSSSFPPSPGGWKGMGEGGQGGEGPAYVIYTSGSTGTPKGVVLDHRGRVNNFADFNRRFGVGPGDRLLAVSSLSFDMTAYDVFGSLMAGGAIVLPRTGDTLDPARWAELMRRRRVTIWHSAPALLELLVQHLEHEIPPSPGGLDLRLVLLGGDWIPLSLPDRLRRFAPNAVVISLGGATEVSMDSTIYRVDEVRPEWTSIPYGRPMANQRAHVVDGLLQPAPIGVPGELLLGGIGVGQGYFQRPELTAAKFVPDPFGPPGARLYCTGDLARFRPDGQLELLGRLDFQVKVRGVRIELGEITAALAQHEAVHEAIVAARPDASGAPRLVGYVVPRSPVPASDLAAYLRGRLPEPMVPTAWVFLEALPLSPNGKVDRRALPEPGPGEARAARGHVPPRTALESVVAGVWSDLLKVEPVGAEDHFFELGGHSLLATQAVSRLRSLLQIDLPLRAFLEAPTVAAVAGVIQNAGQTEGLDMDEVAAVVLQLNELSDDDVQRMLAERAGETLEETAP